MKRTGIVVVALAVVAAAAPHTQRETHVKRLTPVLMVDEQYDQIQNCGQRLLRITKELKRQSQVWRQRQPAVDELQQICDHNRTHIFSGGLQSAIAERHREGLRKSLARAVADQYSRLES